MEIVDVIEAVNQYIPSEYSVLSESIAYAMPIIVLICTLTTVFALLNVNKNSYIIAFYILVTLLALLGGAFQFKFSGHNDINEKNKMDFDQKKHKRYRYKSE